MEFCELGRDLSKCLGMFCQTSTWIVFLCHSMFQIVIMTIDDIEATHRQIVILF